jgi:phytoene synthase
MAMQLSNIARDVHEDWQRGRMYIPESLLEASGAAGLQHLLGQPLPHSAAAGIARATASLLEHADGYYRSGDLGVPYLSFRCGLAIRAARLVYGEISTRVREQGCDPFAPRAVVSRGRKLALLGYALWLSVTRAVGLLGRPAPAIPGEFVKDPASLFAVGG